MLRRLFIRDYVIVDALELEFDAGFGALTGETGAGKSILVEALALILGGRADGAVVRPGRERAEIAAEFQPIAASPVHSWLAANDFAAADELLLRRVIDAGGRSRAYINGLPATINQLRDAAQFLADIHGQHLHHSLLKPETQRAVLDAHGGLTGLASEVGELHRAWRALVAARADAERDAEAGLRERESLARQVAELTGLALPASGWAEAWQQINDEYRRLAHAATLIEGCTAILSGLEEGGEAGGQAGGGAEGGILGMLQQTLARLEALSDYDRALVEPSKLVADAHILLGEAVHALRRYRDRIDIDPGRMAELETRIAAIVGAARKHRVDPEALPDALSALEARFDEITLAADPRLLAEREAAARSAYLSAAERLSGGRETCARKLGQAVTEAMQRLGMEGGRFVIELESVEQGAAFGLEQATFVVSTNAGQPLRPMAKVASGGELSRIGLAIQVIASQAADVPTLIFDEIDVGIGGRVAETVGRLLAELGKRRQVLCVTHLPQVAARADWQWSVAKEESDGKTRSRVTALDHDQRVGELARMLGGARITETTRRHAAELLAGK